MKGKIELLAPAGDMEKLKTAVHFGADAVYLAAKNYGLRAFTSNFELEGLKAAVEYCHARNKKAYVTVNIFAKNKDFDGLKEYLLFLCEIRVDAVIVSDPGIIMLIKKHIPELKIHLSTQANTLNKYSAAFWSDYVERIVLAREVSIADMVEIHEFLPLMQLEAFVHGAMCVSYSGRCLISDYITGRASNRGECAQSCRWQYKLSGTYTLMNGQEGDLVFEEDERGTYLLNSRDLNMIEHIDKLYHAGVTSFKIEGRAKSPYYVGGVVSSYRRALQVLEQQESCGEPYSCPPELQEELEKISHRAYTTGFYFDSKQESRQYYESSKPKQSHEFIAIVTELTQDGIIIEQRNRFSKGDILEVLSAGEAHGNQLIINDIFDAQDRTQKLEIAQKVQQKLFIPTNLQLLSGDLLRKKL